MRVDVAILISVAWMAWAAPFFLLRKGPATAQTVDRRARWGIAIEAIGFAIVWQMKWWIRDPSAWRVAGGALLLTMGAALTWTSAFALGRQWRFDAGLNADHALVQSGAYRLVRHPIYASMLCMLLGTALLRTPAVLILVALLFFVTGTEIRVRIEDGLLASRFGPAFEDYRRRVPAYIPFTRF
jgi:protein-S-isoprenylcysteine O-methyltransferase Ste14